MLGGWPVCCSFVGCDHNMEVDVTASKIEMKPRPSMYLYQLHLTEVTRAYSVIEIH